MAETTDNAGSETISEPTIRFAVQTPFGARGVNLADLPEELRDALAQSLHGADLPTELRVALGKALGVDLADLPESTQDGTEGPASVTPGAESTEGAEGTENAAQDAHAPGCNCAELHREHVWDILDTAFPTDPHLWQAMEALFAISAANPQEIDDATRRSALSLATLHIQRSTALTVPPLSPMEQMLAEFRNELGL
jgi:hypothetical protein